MPQLYSKPNGKEKSGKQKFKPDPNKYLYNIDTFWYNCRSYMYEEVMSRGLRQKLIDGRTYSSDNDDHMIVEVKIPQYEHPLKFKVMPGNPPMYQYSLRNDSMAIYFRKSEHKEGSLMRVQINQFVLWDKGFIGAYEESLEVLKALGFLPYEKKINRVDFAVHSDQYVWNYEDMQTFDYPMNIAQDNFPVFYRLDPRTGNFGTCAIGDRSRLYLRIYNKSKEIEDKKKFYFNEIYKKHDMDPNNIWNVEIEVRRPFLKDLQEANEDDEEFKRIFDDIDYCIENQGLSRLWSYLVSEKYGHGSAHWSTLKNGDPKKFQNISDYNLKLEKDIDSNFEREKNQIAGRLMVGVINEEDYSLGNALRVFLDKYLGDDPEEKMEEWNEKVRDKKQFIHDYKINKSARLEEMKLENNMKKYRGINIAENPSMQQKILVATKKNEIDYKNRKNQTQKTPD